MSSPAKRRKLNSSNVAQPKSRGLDFFFGKQQTKAPTEQDNVPASSAGSTRLGQDEAPLTDEQLARQLQEEWNKEDNVAPGSTQEQTSSAELQARDGIPTIPEGVTDGQIIDVRNDAQDTQDSGHGGVVEAVEENAKVTANSTHTLSLQSATAAEDTITGTIPFDQSPLSFDPAQYTSALQKQWALEGGSATYALLTHCFVLVNATQSRIKIVDTLVNLLRVIIEGDPESLLPAVCSRLYHV